MPRILQLHRDEVGRARAVAGRDAVKRVVQRFRWFCVADPGSSRAAGQFVATSSGRIRMPLRLCRAPAAFANVTACDR